LALIAVAAVLFGTIIGVIVLKATGSDSSPETTERTRRTTTVPETDPDETTTTLAGDPTAELESVLVTLDDVKVALSANTWTELPGLDPYFVSDSTFCGFTNPTSPSFSVLKGYQSDNDTEVYSRIDQFADDAEALRSLGQDQSLAANCTGEHPYLYGDIEYTSTLFDASASFIPVLGNDSAAVGYVLTPPADSDEPEITGYIIEWRKGPNIVSAELSATGRLPSDDENDQFGNLVATYFLRSDALS
jgi:hypothetical protein